MTDESFVYHTEVNERANIARNSKNRVSKSGCILPSDHISHWAKKRKNGDVVIMTPNRPILYDDFKELSEDSQREYLQGLIDNYGGTTERIAKMWGVSEAKIKNHRQLLGTKTRLFNPIKDNENFEIDAQKWEKFLSAGDFMKEPMNYNEFKKLSTNEKKAYLTFLNIELDGSPFEIADLFGIHVNNIRILLRKNNIPSHGRQYRYSHTKWNKWLQKYDVHYDYPNTEPVIHENSEEPSTIDSTDYIPTEQKPIEIRESDIPYLNLIMTVKDYEQIFDILKTLPRAQSGTITFTFGEESEKLET